jgi:hypothetical protein
MSVQRRCSKTPAQREQKEKALKKTEVLFRGEHWGATSRAAQGYAFPNNEQLQPDLARLLLLGGPADDALLAASVTDLIGTDPFPLDRPGAEALVVGVVAGEVAVLDQAAAGVSAGEVDDFELWGVSVRSSLRGFHLFEWKRR